MIVWITAAVRRRIELEEGQALVEYALIITLIALVAIGGLTLLGGPAPGVFSELASVLEFHGHP